MASLHLGGIIDLVEPDDDPGYERRPELCGDPHHAEALRSMRKQLHNYRQTIQQTKAQHEQEIAAKDVSIAERHARVVELTKRDVAQYADIARLQAQVDTLTDKLKGRGKRQTRTWPNKLKAFITRGDRQLSYKDIYKLCCKEENMSTNTDFTHPNIRLGVTSNGWRPEDAAAPAHAAVADTFRFFRSLPAKVQAEIFRLWLKKERPVHCFSRLDLFTEPSVWPLSRSASGMYNRFYWGEARLLNLQEDTVDPQEVLALLLVSKDFYFKGVHAFYGLNTFAFSSIGEFGRFCQGIGPERAARLQHIEKVWTGSQYLTAKHTFSVRDGKQVEHWDSARTRPVAFLSQLPRLKTLEIFLDESGPLYERRKYESPDTKATLLDRTAQQPNFRKHRSFRNLQGIDHVYALRGLDWVRFYDLWAMQRDGSPCPALSPIRDTSFTADVNSAVTMPKSAETAKQCELRNLPLLFPAKEGPAAAGAGVQAGNRRRLKPWDPPAVDWSTIEEICRDSEPVHQDPYEPTRTYYGVRGRNAVVGPGAAAPLLIDGNERNDNQGRLPSGVAGRNGADDLLLRHPGLNGGNEEVRPRIDAPRDQRLGILHSGRQTAVKVNGMPDHATERNRGSRLTNDDHTSLFVDDDDHDDDHELAQHEDKQRLSRQEGPSRPQASTLGEPLPGPSRRLALQARSAASLNASTGPSRPTSEKRPSENGVDVPAKRQKQEETRARSSSEQLIRNLLGALANSGSIASLLNPFAVHLRGRDWAFVNDILRRRTDARDDPVAFRRHLEADGQQHGMQESVQRITRTLQG